MRGFVDGGGVRGAFARAVLARDGGRCVSCRAAPAEGAHALVEPRLFADGGLSGALHADNGVSLCAACGEAAWRTELDPEALRRAAGIARARIPEHLEASQAYDRWGNPIMANGSRLRGEMFGDPEARAALDEGGAIGLFSSRVKAPRTYHLPWSPGRSDDDKVLGGGLEGLRGRRVVVSEKMDGEGTTLYPDGFLHARSPDGRGHPSRDWLKRWWAKRAHELPEGWRITGENVYARHSLAYDGLPSYFLGFGVWDERNVRLAWDDCLEWFALLGVEPVPVLYDGPFDESAIRALPHGSGPTAEQSEGYVVAAADPIPYGRYRDMVGKFVRAGHVQTDQHWTRGPVVPNGLAGGVGKPDTGAFRRPD